MTSAANAANQIGLFGYNPLRDERTAGIGFTVLEHPSGVQLCLTQEGWDAMQNMESFAGLVGQMTMHIAKYDEYVFESTQTREQAGMDALSIANRRHRNASVYSPLYLPEFIVKSCLDRGNHSAPLQFPTMSWLHRKLAQSDQSNLSVSVSAPVQYAMLTSPNKKQKTIIMERAPGKPMQLLAYDFNEELSERDKTTLQHDLPPLVYSALWKTLGRGVALVTDVTRGKNRSNLLVDVNSLGNRPKVSIIDQPNTDWLISRAKTNMILATL